MLRSGGRRAALYARQSAFEDQGIAQQVEDTTAYATRQGWTIVEVYADNDVSGSTERDEATQWAAMLRAFDAGHFDILLVTETSRLTRRLTDVLEVRPPRRDMRVVVVRQGIDTAVEDFALKMLVLMAEQEVKVKAERARRYALERRKAGHPAPGRTPYGYRWVPSSERDKHGTRYAVNLDEATDVRLMFREFLSAAPLAQIARDLNVAGRRTRSGTRWSSTTVRRILMNPFYAALLPPSQPSGKYDLKSIALEECAPGAWEALVERRELVAARGLLVNAKPRHSGTARKWLLSGLAVCSVCERPVRSARGETHPTARVDGSGTATSKRYHTYRCVDGHLMRNADLIDEFVKEAMIGRLSLPDTSTMINAADSVDVGVLIGQQAELESRQGSIAALIAGGKMQPAQAVNALDELADEIAHITAQIEQAIRVDPLAEVRAVDDVRGWWEQASLARRRSVVDALALVKIHPVGRGRRVTTLEHAAETVSIGWRP